MKNNIMEIKNLKKYFIKEKGLINKTRTSIKAVNNVSLNILNGETFGVVGESGCGKSTLARTLMLLIQPTDGDIIFKGENISDIDKTKLRKEMAIVFQDPHSSLSPRRSIIKTLKEPFVIHNVLSGQKLKNRVLELLNIVGLKEEHLYRFPHEFSGGQKQRIGIARAISLNPNFLVLDEPTSALDVSVQAQILNLLQDLQQKMDLTMLFITHDLSVIEYISDRIAVMYMGKMVELGSVDQIFDNPLHPYTNILLDAIPEPNPNEDMQEINIKGEIPSLTDLPKGCNFQSRCPYASKDCSEDNPSLSEIEPGHFSACVLNQKN
ncbi:MAG: ABC transporter ATP-binding protein [Bacillota bacterium]